MLLARNDVPQTPPKVNAVGVSGERHEHAGVGGRQPDVGKQETSARNLLPHCAQQTNHPPATVTKLYAMFGASRCHG